MESGVVCQLQLSRIDLSEDADIWWVTRRIRLYCLHDDSGQAQVCSTHIACLAIFALDGTPPAHVRRGEILECRWTSESAEVREALLPKSGAC